MHAARARGLAQAKTTGYRINFWNLILNGAAGSDGKGGQMADSARPAARQPRAKAAARPWQWARTADTQRALLDAAREVFTEQGFADASIADVVERAGSSVGSLYHHFGGKSELFIALWHEHQHAQEEAASKAVAQAKQAGVTDSFELFCAGTRAFLEGCWQRRDLAMLFYDGDGPAGFELVRRQRGHEWIGQNDTLLRLADTSFDRLYAVILTSLSGAGGREVAAAKTRRQANRIIDAVLEYARRLMTGGPWHPPAASADEAGAASAPAAGTSPRRAPARRPASR